MGLEIAATAIDGMLTRERALFLPRNPASKALAGQAPKHRAPVRAAERLERGIAEVIIKYGADWRAAHDPPTHRRSHPSSP
jgi:hypothetical protein